MAEYTIKDLSKISKTTERAIRQLLDKNKELSELKQEHTIKRQNRVFYDEVIYNWFLEYYKDKIKSLVEDAAPVGETENENKEITETIPPLSAVGEEIAALSAELEEIKAKYAALQADFEKVEGERVDLMRQNGLKTDEISRLLLLLQEEKQEKQQIMLMLPPPKRTLKQRIKALFSRKEGN